MKAYLRVIAILLLTAMFAACGSALPVIELPAMDTEAHSWETVVTDAPVTTVPPSSETEEPEKEKEPSLWTKLTDEQWKKHEAMGFIGRNQIKDFNAEEFYGGWSYESRKAQLADRVYRALLDLELYRKVDIKVQRYAELEQVFERFMEGKKPSLFYGFYKPAGIALDNFPLNDLYTSVIDIIAKDYTEQLLRDEEMKELFLAVHNFNLKDGIENGDDFLDKFGDVPQVLELLYPGNISVKEQSLNYDNCMTEVKFDAPANSRIVVSVDGAFKGYVPYSAGAFPYKSIVLDAGEPLLLNPLFDGEIWFAAVDENGFMSKVESYEVRSAEELLPVKEVVFRSEYMDRAVRKYLQIGSTKAITTKDLLSIEWVIVGDNTVAFDTHVESHAFTTSREWSEDNDFCFEDLDWFYGLNFVRVYNMPIKVLPEGRYLHADYLSFTRCGIEDISALYNSTARQIAISDSVIKNADAFEGMNYLYEIWTQLWGTAESVRLPAKSFETIRISAAQLDSIEFLQPVNGISRLDITVSKPVNTDVLLRYQGMKLLRVYGGAITDFSFIPKMAGLEAYYDGRSLIELE